MFLPASIYCTTRGELGNNNKQYADITIQQQQRWLTTARDIPFRNIHVFWIELNGPFSHNINDTDRIPKTDRVTTDRFSVSAETILVCRQRHCILVTMLGVCRQQNWMLVNNDVGGVLNMDIGFGWQWYLECVNDHLYVLTTFVECR